MIYSTILAALVAAVAAKDSRTFAVLHFYGDGPLTEGRADPIISPGQISAHHHTIQGGNAFSLGATGESLKKSTCTSSLIKNDLSAYWAPTLFFQSPENGTLTKVPLFYMNVYYFFEATDDKITAFPTGLQMVSGNAMLRSYPNITSKSASNPIKPGQLNQDPSMGTIQPTQWTCPRSSYNPPSYPTNSDGSTAGIVDPNNKGSGMGFPFENCDGYASPLRMDLHFPSCYNPAAGLTNYKENMQFPSSAGGGKSNCPAGWIHTPHIFFELYWNTPKFKDAYSNWGNGQPFVLSSGDRTGYSGHGDFIAAWDEPTLQQIIDNCDAGDRGMDQCPGLIGGTNLNSKTSCNIPSPVDEVVTGWLQNLPGNNPVAGWGVGDTSAASSGSTGSSGSGSSSSSAAASAGASTAARSSATAAASTASTQSDAAVNNAGSTSTSTAAAASTTAPAAAGNGNSNTDLISTIYETATVWKTVTEYDDTGSSTAVVTSAATKVIASTVTGAATATHQASASSSVAGFTYAGCYEDDSGRVLAGEIRPNLGKISNTLCVTYCKSKGFAAAGTEYGGQCYCGNDLSDAKKLAETACNMPCEGAASETCGGSWALSLYTVDGKLPKVNGTVETTSVAPSATGPSKATGTKAARVARHLGRHRYGAPAGSP